MAHSTAALNSVNFPVRLVPLSRNRRLPLIDSHTAGLLDRATIIDFELCHRQVFHRGFCIGSTDRPFAPQGQNPHHDRFPPSDRLKGVGFAGFGSFEMSNNKTNLNLAIKAHCIGIASLPKSKRCFFWCARR